MSKLEILFTIVIMLGSIHAVAEMPRDYYPDNLEGRNKEDLKTELHKLIKEHRRIEYGSKGTWIVFRESDIRDDGTIWDMYSDVERYFPASGAHRQMNIEHSVPKSWWGDDYPYTVDGSFDLHHLVPSDADANSAKSNYALGEVEGVPSFDNGVSRVGKATGYSFNVFEPDDEYKGDFARMYMYFVTCYQDYSWRSLGTNMFITGSYPTLNNYSQALLLRWHRQDPVSKKEIDRNNAVYRHQYNRNPFIDYPQLAEYIWGDSTEYVFRFVGEPVVAPSLNYKSGDVIQLSNEILNASHTENFVIKGVNITSPIRLSVEDNSYFDVSPAILSVDDVNHVQGATVSVTYHPGDYGIHSTRLILQCDDMPDDIYVTLQALCMPEEVAIVAVDELQKSYPRTHPHVKLTLRNNTDEVTWRVDGVALPDGIFSPSTLSEGIHTITFVTTTVRGKVRVAITQ